MFSSPGSTPTRPALVAWRLSIGGFALACLLVAVVGWISYRRLVELQEAAHSVGHTLRVGNATDVLMSLIKDAETGERGFLITGERSYLQPYEKALEAIPGQLEQLRQLTRDSRRQQARVVTLEGLIQRKLAELAGTLTIYRSGGAAAAARTVLGGEGKQLMDTIRAIIADIDAEEEQLLIERTALEERRARAASYTTVGSLGLALLFLIAATVLLSRAIRERGRAQAGRVAAEAVAVAIAESESRFRVTLASIGDAVITTDDQGRVTLMNGVAETLTGWTRTAAMGRPLEDVLVIVNEETRRPADNPVRRVVREGRVAGLANHTLLISKAGREIPIDDSAAPIRSEDGSLVGAVMIFRDITERREAERERASLLRREQAQRTEAERVARMLRNVQFVTDAALGEASLDGLMRESLANVRATMGGETATIFLLTEDGAHLMPISSEGLREELVDNVRVPLGRGIVGRIALSEAGLIFADLSLEEVMSRALSNRVKSLVGAPLRVGRRLIGVIHVGASMPQRFTEEDLKLLTLVAERMALFIERARLHAAESAARHDAEAANRAKDEFLAMVSHELREPIHAILGWLEVVRAGQGDEATVPRALEVIERNAKLQEKVVGDLLDVSRGISGQLRLDIQPTDLGAVVAAAIDVVHPAADAKGVRLESVSESGVLVSGDPGRLQQVVWNLLSNAIRFTPRDGRVTVLLRRVDSEAVLAVSDTGEGISQAFLPHVFERFRQASRPTGKSHGGLGLGLAIVRHLVELHGGTVQAESPGEGRGATFTVRLPVLAIQGPAPALEAAPMAASIGSASRLDGVRVLVVDDEAGAREMLRTVLEARGAVVTMAVSTADALGRLRRDRPDVLISDVAMPGEDGYRLIGKVRALPVGEGGRVPAIAVTARARAEDRTRALLAGFDLHVPKPVEGAELAAVIATVLSRTVSEPVHPADAPSQPAS